MPENTNPESRDFQYLYKANVVDVYDGDTITVDIDLGCGIWLRGEKIRLYGIDTPEMRGDDRPRGIIVRDYVRKRILRKQVVIQTILDKSGKFGRLLGLIYESPDMGESLNAELIRLGMAREALY